MYDHESSSKKKTGRSAWSGKNDKHVQEAEEEKNANIFVKQRLRKCQTPQKSTKLQELIHIFQ